MDLGGVRDRPRPVASQRRLLEPGPVPHAARLAGILSLVSWTASSPSGAGRRIPVLKHGRCRHAAGEALKHESGNIARRLPLENGSTGSVPGRSFPGCASCALRAAGGVAEERPQAPGLSPVRSIPPALAAQTGQGASVWRVNMTLKMFLRPRTGAVRRQLVEHNRLSRCARRLSRSAARLSRSWCVGSRPRNT